MWLVIANILTWNLPDHVSLMRESRKRQYQLFHISWQFIFWADFSLNFRYIVSVTFKIDRFHRTVPIKLEVKVTILIYSTIVTIAENTDLYLGNILFFLPVLIKNIWFRMKNCLEADKKIRWKFCGFLFDECLNFLTRMVSEILWRGNLPFWIVV